MTFKVGVTRDLLMADGKPCFGTKAFDVLQANPDISWEWIAEDLDEITPDVAARYDALHVNLPRVTAASVARDDCRVKIVARNGVGYDTVDLDATVAKNIIVTNTPVAVRRPVAVAALTMVFALAGRLFKKDQLVREGRWNDRVDYMGQGLTTRTLGVIGAGSIGKETLALARPFFGRMVAADPYADIQENKALGADILPLDEMMAEADFVVTCCDLNDATFHLVNEERLALMKQDAYFINMARGPVHDEKALTAALVAGKIAGAGLDVTEREPIEPDSPLLDMENVIITAHALCWTDECFYDIAATALQSIVDCSLGKRPKFVVEPRPIF